MLGWAAAGALQGCEPGALVLSWVATGCHSQELREEEFFSHEASASAAATVSVWGRRDSQASRLNDSMVKQTLRARRLREGAWG